MISMAKSTNLNEFEKIAFQGMAPADGSKESASASFSASKGGLESTVSLTEIDFENEYSPNCYLGLGVDPVALDERLHEIINGAGDKIDQLFLYLSPTSAAAWKRKTALEDYRAGTTIPVEEIVEQVDILLQKMTSGRRSINVISLGSGEARQEQRLVQTLIRQNSTQKVYLFLVDASHPMLNVGFSECKKVFASYPEVKSLAMYQNFMELPQNKKFLQAISKPNQVNLLTMLGCTFANLEQEMLFLRNTLGAFPSKTMLLIDIITPYGASDNVEEIKQNDPQFSARRPYSGPAEEHLATPFIQHHRKVREARDVKFFPVLDNRTCNLKGSYTVEVKAQIDQDQWTFQKRCDLLCHFLFLRQASAKSKRLGLSMG